METYYGKSISKRYIVTNLVPRLVPTGKQTAGVAHKHEEETLAEYKQRVIKRRLLHRQRARELGAVEPVRLGGEELPRDVPGRLLGEPCEDVVGEGARSVGGLDLGGKQGLHHRLGLVQARESVGGRAHDVGHIPPESEVVPFLAILEEDALAGQADPEEGGGEGCDGADGVEVVYGDAVGCHVVVGGPLLGEEEDAAADGGVEEADPDGGGVALAARLDGGEVAGDLDDVLESLEEAAPGDVDAEAACSGEGFYDAAAAHAAYEGLECEL